MTFTASNLRDQIIRATDASDGEYNIDAITEEILAEHGAVDIDSLDTDEFWAIVGKHATDQPTAAATQITLPTPVLTADFVQRHEGTDGVAPLLRTLGEAIARETILGSLSVIRSTHQGISLNAEIHAADDALADAEKALDNHIAEWDGLTKMAHEVRARDAAIAVLSGMVARLIAEKH